MDDRIFADRRTVIDRRVRKYLHPGGDAATLSDYDICGDLNMFGDRCGLIDHGGRMNPRNEFRRREKCP